MIEGINPVPPQNLGSYDPTAKQQEESRLKQAAKQFEQVFMQQMFTEMHVGEATAIAVLMLAMVFVASSPAVPPLFSNPSARRKKYAT